MSAVDRLGAVHAKPERREVITSPCFRQGEDGWVVASGDPLVVGDIIEVAKKDGGTTLVLITEVLGTVSATGVTESAFCQLAHWRKDENDLDRDMFSAFLMRHVEIDGSVQTLDLDAARAELISSSDGIHKVGAGGHPCDSTTKRQDIGARPDETRSESEKRKSSNRRPPGKRSLVRIRKRRMAKANGTSDSTARPEDGVSALAENQPLPTARVA